MEILLNILLSVGMIFALFCLFMLKRNNDVYRFRIALLERIKIAAGNDTEDWRWRYKAFDESSYQEQMHKFWRPLKVENFYANDDFLK